MKIHIYNRDSVEEHFVANEDEARKLAAGRVWSQTVSPSSGRQMEREELEYREDVAETWKEKSAAYKNYPA